MSPHPKGTTLYMFIVFIEYQCITHRGRVTHICVGKLAIIGSDNGHYLNQCWNIIDWTLRNKLQWNFNRILNIFHSGNCTWKYRLWNGVHFVAASDNYCFYHFPTLQWLMLLKYFIVKERTVFFTQSYGCWLPGDAMSQNISSSSYCIDHNSRTLSVEIQG